MVPESIKKQLNLLINLAARDSTIGEHEEKLIIQIGTANGVSVEELKSMFENPTPVEDFSTLTDEQRFEHLFHLIQVMKVDGIVLKSEIDFCEKSAVHMGYARGVVAELSAHMYSSTDINADRDLLVNIVSKYLKK